MSLLELYIGPVMFGPVAGIPGVKPVSINNAVCKVTYNKKCERERAQAGSDGICWWCTSCKTTRSIHINSFFSKSKLTLRQWFLLIVWWALEYSVCTAAVEAEVTSCQAYKWLREQQHCSKPQTSLVALV